MDLDRIEVESDIVRASSVFHCGQQLREGAKAVNLPKFWVSGLTEHNPYLVLWMIHASFTPHTYTSQATAEYELTLYTSNIRGAGTDADVTLLISGDNGSADEIKLYNGPQNFTRASTDKFTFTAKDVGSNKRLTFRLVSDGVMGHWGAYTFRWTQRTPL